MIIMKKDLFYLMCILLFLGCSKKEVKDLLEFDSSNTVQLLSSNEKGMTYGGTVNIGHSASGCTGCVSVGGVLVHVDCTGSGNACRATVKFRLTSDGDTIHYYSVILNPDELTHEDFFLMPDRSLYVIGSNGQFLNIPEQMVYRDEETDTFIFYDIFFSDSQVFENK